MELAKSLIAEELSAFEKKFADAVKSQTPLLDRIMKYIIKRKGKQLRPMFVFLCAKLNGEVNESTFRAAALVELLHTATLVHDDVVDESLERRGFFSINALWKNKIAVLVGDYLLSKGLLLSTAGEDFKHLQILSEAVKQMSEGELLQIEKARKLNLKEEVYFEIIRSRPDRAIIQDAWIEQAIRMPIREVIQTDGRIRRWIQVENRFLRVILLTDGETVHNAFFDRRFVP